MHLQTLACLVATTAVLPAHATTSRPCPAVTQSFSAPTLQQYRNLLRGEFPQGSVPSLTQAMQEQRWLVLFASSNQTERGVFFYRRSDRGTWVHLQTWGGVPAGDSADSIAKWPVSAIPGFPAGLAHCFANEVVNGE